MDDNENEINLLKRKIKQTLVVSRAKTPDKFKTKFKCKVAVPRSFKFYNVVQLEDYISLVNYIFGKYKDDKDLARVTAYYIALAPNQNEYDRRFENYVK